jgi:hypothetical protein
VDQKYQEWPARQAIWAIGIDFSDKLFRPSPRSSRKAKKFLYNPGTGGAFGRYPPGAELKSTLMAASPVFITQYEILRTSDYVLITVSAPTGEVVDGKMQVQEVQQLALTLGRFVEMAGLMTQIAKSIGAPDPQNAWRRGVEAPGAPRQGDGEAEDAEAPKLPSDWVIRH